jgi:hypothetical protein
MTYQWPRPLTAISIKSTYMLSTVGPRRLETPPGKLSDGLAPLQSCRLRELAGDEIVRSGSPSELQVPGAR